MTPQDRERELIEAFAFIENRQERLGAVVDRARHRPRLPQHERVEANLVAGCSSQVWLVGETRDGRCEFRADCDSPLVKGLVSVVVDTYNGATPAEVVAAEPRVLQELDLWRDLSPTRQNGLNAIRRRIVELAQPSR